MRGAQADGAALPLARLSASSAAPAQMPAAKILLLFERAMVER